jgi:hypothetical protein
LLPVNKKQMKIWKAMNKEFALFKKPKNRNPTQHLWVANGGVKCGFTQSQLSDIFSKSGAVEGIYMNDNESHAFVSYTNPNDAASAKSMLVCLLRCTLLTPLGY